MTLKICHVISGDLWAGAEVMAFYLLNGLNTQPGLELCVILLNHGRLSEALEKAGITIYVIDESNQSFLAIVRKAATIIREWAPHIIHSHRYKENILSYLISITLKKRPALISTQHGLPENHDGSPNLISRLKSKINYQILASRFDRMVAVSQDVKESLIMNYGFQEKRVFVIHNGIIVPDTTLDCRMKDHFLIGSAGRFFPVKDYLFMVEVAREVVKKSNKIRFELAGEGPQLGDIQRLINKYGLEQYLFLRGFLPDMSPFYQELDIYMSTSLHEGIPMSVLEAMAYRLPTIAPKVGGLREIITDGIDGYLLSDRNPEDFANKCLLLHENHTLRHKMAHAAREKITREFSTQRMVENYIDIYRQIT